MARKKILNQSLEDNLRQLRGNIVALVEAIFRIRDNKGNLIDYKLAEPHRQLLTTGLLGNKTCLKRIINKGRQIGFSYFQGIESLCIAHKYPNTFQYYVATKEDKAKNWLEKVKNLARDSRLLPNGKKLLSVDERRSTQLTVAVKHTDLDNVYSYIIGLPASPEGVRGETAISIILDEFDQMRFTKNLQRELYNSIRYFISQGGQMTIQSTPLTSTERFWELYKHAEEYMMKSFDFPVIANWRDLDFNQDLRTQNCQIPYHWVNIDEMEQARRDDLDSFKQECLGIPMDSLIKFLDPDLIYANVTSQEVFENKEGNSWIKIAIDWAQKRDITAITVGEFLNDNIYERWIEESQAVYTSEDPDVEGQFQLIKRLCQRYKPMEIIIDNTGIGIALGDMIEADGALPPLRRIDFASYVVLGEKKVRMTHYLAEEFKRALIDGRYKMLENNKVLKHLERMEKAVTDTGMVKYTGKRSGERDDHFWSKAMLNANFGLNEHEPIFGMMKDEGVRGRFANVATLKNQRRTHIGW